jgi:hypothetical protein
VFSLIEVWHDQSKFGFSISIVLFILGIVQIGIGFGIKKRLREVCRIIYPSQSPIANRQSQISNG